MAISRPAGADGELLYGSRTVGLLVMAGMVLLLIAFREPRPKTAMALAT
jgi:hypothetical protein